MERIKELRKQKKITMKKLGNVIGVSESTISLYENGKRQPDNDTLKRLADFFNVSVDYLLDRTDEKNPSESKEDVTFDDFTYAMYNESRDLTEEDKEALLGMAKLLKKKLRENAE